MCVYIHKNLRVLVCVLVRVCVCVLVREGVYVCVGEGGCVRGCVFV